MAKIDLEYPSNSNNKKHIQDVVPLETHTKIETKSNAEKKDNRVVTTNVIRKQQTLTDKFKDVFFSNEIDIIDVIVIPGLQKLAVDVSDSIFDTLKDAVAAKFGIESRSRRRDSYTDYSSISSYYGSEKRYREERERRKEDVRSRKTLDDIIFRSKSEAVEVRDILVEYVDRFGKATVGDLYDKIGERARPSDYSYGWTELGSAKIISAGRDGYMIDFPRPTFLG